MFQELVEIIKKALRLHQDPETVNAVTELLESASDDGEALEVIDMALEESGIGSIAELLESSDEIDQEGNPSHRNQRSKSDSSRRAYRTGETARRRRRGNTRPSSTIVVTRRR